MMLFDGERVKAMYRFKTDPLLKQNMVDKVPQQKAMEQQLKSLIQQYMHRMSNNQLIYSPAN